MLLFSVCIMSRGAEGARVWDGVSVSSCRCCMFVSCVHHVAVLNAAFCMTCSLLMLVEDERGDHMEEAPNDTAYKWIRCNRIEHCVYLRCAGIRLAQYTETWTCHLNK